jgi:hypothetical protein
MDAKTREALQRDGIIDITTVGRENGRPHRIETGLFRANGRLYLTGSPGRRDWYANLLANPDFVIHLKRSVTADVPAHGTPVTEPEARQTILASIVRGLGRSGDLDAWVQRSPLVAIQIDGFETAG